MRRTILALALAATFVSGAVVLDRIAVIVGKHVIKLSDIDRDLRVTDFLNRAPLDLSSQAKRQSAERLINQQIIRQEIVNSGYRRPGESEATRLEEQIAHDRYSGSDALLRQALARYGLTEGQLHEQLLWQLTVLQFIDQRFRPGVFISDDEVRAYYEQHLGELRNENRKDNSFEALVSKIRSLLEGEQINKDFADWLQEARKNYRIEYKQAAFA